MMRLYKSERRIALLVGCYLADPLLGENLIDDVSIWELRRAMKRLKRLAEGEKVEFDPDAIFWATYFN